MREHLCEGRPGDKECRMLYQTEDCVSYRVQNEAGELLITEHCIFPGVWLTYKDAHASKYIYPPAYPSGLLEITHCREGRFEYDAGGTFFYLSKGDMSITQSIGHMTAVYCPTRHYHGVSIAIDPAVAPHCFTCILDDVDVRPSVLFKKFCSENRPFIMRSTARLEHLFSELYAVPEDIQKGYYKVKILELLLFLSNLDPTLSQTEQHACSRAQMELAQQVCAFIDTHRQTRLTIEQLAAQFYVSPAQLKKCFYNVYGESVYAYIRTYKMQCAAQRLKTTDQTIAEIAGSFGYDNSSKFAKAFRDVMGVSPSAYRQADEPTDP